MSRAAVDLPEDPAELRRFAAALAAEVHAKTLLIEKLKTQPAILLRIPTKPAMHSNMKPATCSDLKPASVPI